MAKFFASNKMKVIILKRDKLGDLLLTTPAIQLLKLLLPEIKITLIVPEYSSWVLKDAPFIDKLYFYPQVRFWNVKSFFAVITQIKIFLKIRLEKYDFAIAASGAHSLRAIKRLKWIGATRTIGFIPDHNVYSNLTDPIIEINKKLKGPHEAIRLIELLRPIVDFKENISFPDVWFVPPKEWILKAKDFLKKNNLSQQEYIVFGIGTRHLEKKPSKKQIITTSKYIYKKNNLKTILVWTPGKSNDKSYPGDDDFACDILSETPQEIIPLRAPMDLTIGLIWLAKKSIFPDSGLMHFAAASPGGVIGLFANGNISPPPERWKPLGVKSTYLEAKKDIKDLGDNFLYHEISRL